MLDALRSLHCPPSFIVNSGGGLQAFWQLEEPTGNCDQVEGINRAIRDLLHADACHNIDRLMRLPGFINWPDAKKRARGRVPALATVIEPDDGVVYPLHQLEAAFPGNPEEQRQAAPVDEKVEGEEEPPRQDIAYISPDDLGLDKYSPIRSAIEHPPGRDRSGDLLAAARLLANAGYTKDQMFAVLLNPANRVSAHAYDQRDPRRTVLRVIEIAAERAEVVVASDDEAEPEAAKVMQYPWYDSMPEGPMKDFIDATLAGAMCPQPNLALLAAICTFGAAAGRRYQGPTALCTNFYALALASSGMGKQDAISSVEALLEDAGHADLLGGSQIVSDAGLMVAVTRNLGNIISTIAAIPGFASGTNSAPRGLAVVGERGPELVRFRGGEQVIPNHAIGNMNVAAAGGGTVVQHFHLDARGAVMTQDIVNQINSMGQRAAEAGARGGHALAQQDLAQMRRPKL